MKYLSVLTLLTLGVYFAPAHAGCATNRNNGMVFCGPGDCSINAQTGQVFCSAFTGGGAATNGNTGQVLCGNGQADTSQTVTPQNCQPGQ